MPPEYHPIGEVLRGLEIMDLPDKYTALDAVVLIKAIDADGDVSWLTRNIRSCHIVEQIGAMETALQLYLHDVMALYKPNDDEDGDGDTL